MRQYTRASGKQEEARTRVCVCACVRACVRVDSDPKPYLQGINKHVRASKPVDYNQREKGEPNLFCGSY